MMIKVKKSGRCNFMQMSFSSSQRYTHSHTNITIATIDRCGWKFHSESATNNVAEYFGLLSGLKCARSFGINRLIAEGDSQLIVKQLNGEYRVKDAVLKTFYTASVDTIKDFDYFEIRHIPRAENSRADWLANLAMDSQESHGFDEAPDV